MKQLKRLLLFFLTLILVHCLQPSAVILATSASVINSHARVLEQKAQNLYEQNQLEQATEVLKAAIARYQDQGDIVGSAIASRNLALIYQKLGEWSQAEVILSQAQELIATLDSEAEQSQLLAQLLEVQGQIELSLGRSQAALETWQQATSLYQQQGNITGLTQGKIYQANALQALGLYSQAIKTLTAVENQLEDAPDNLMKAQAFLNIGTVLGRVGSDEEAQAILESSLAIAQKLAEKSLAAEILLSLGNTARLQDEPERALELYQQAIDTDSRSDIRLRGQLERLNILISQQLAAIDLAADIEQLLSKLPPQQTTIQGQISLAHHLLALEAKPSRIAQLLVSAIKQARNLGIARTQAEALGALGHLYERQQQWQEAKKTTERALIVAQSANATELTYQWQWQLGRILKAQGNTEGAIASYTQATNNLESLRSDLVAISSDIQYSFREEIEPVYRELAALLLQPQASPADLAQARQIIDSLQVATLDNFFRDACLDTQPVQIDQLDPTAAIIYAIVLDHRLEVIAAIPGQPLRHFSNDLPPAEIEIVVSSANSFISTPRRLNLKPLQQAYDWLIRPIDADLKANEIQTLVFVPDGILRNLPPATLHDGQQYLIEQYSVAIAPSLQLVELQSINDNRQEILLAGLSQPRQGFSRLPGVKQEIEQIEPLFASEVLLNDAFTEFNFLRFASEIPFRVVHLATHGQFSSNAEDTFVLTWDERISIDELGHLIRADSKQLRPIELLVLSACETATGDQLAALGLAGIAVRGGARSTVASLWAVSDEATVVLMTNFYQELAKGNITKAEALRRSQLVTLKRDRFSHPYYWSAFILVGNWQ